MITSYGPKTPDGLDSTGVVSIVNSSVAALTGAATFTGVWEDVSGYDSVVVSLLTDADGTLSIQFSPDGTNVDSSLSVAVTASSNETHRVTVTRKYFRVVMVNGAAAQSYMRLQSIKGEKQLLTSLLNSSIQDDDDSVLTRAIQEESLIAEGKFIGRYNVNKFGRNPDIDTGTIPEDIWSGGGAYTGFPTGAAETVDITSSSVNDIGGGSGMQTMRIYGLDANYEGQTEDVTMNGSTGVTTVGTWTRIYRAYGLTAGASGTNEGNITINHTTTTANIFGYMIVGYGQTETAGFTVPSGYTGYLRYYNVSMLDKTPNNAQVSIWYREFGRMAILRSSFTVSTEDRYTESIYGGIQIPEKTDFIFRVIDVHASNAIIAASFDIIMVKN